MLGCQDFCGYYEWTFHYLRRNFGEAALGRYWREAIALDSQSHYVKAAKADGLQGLYDCWVQTGESEACDWTVNLAEDGAQLYLNMMRCPSKGFLLEHDLNADEDYCDHCAGWIREALSQADLEVARHEHNHCGQCWWQIEVKDKPGPVLTELVDIQRSADWNHGYLHRYEHSERVPAQDEGAAIDSVSAIRQAFAKVAKIETWIDDCPATIPTASGTDSLAVICIDRAYLNLPAESRQPRAILLGHDEIDWHRLGVLWNAAEPSDRPLLLHPYLPAQPQIAFGHFELPRPLPLLPILIRSGCYFHKPGTAPTTLQFAELLVQALTKLREER